MQLPTSLISMMLLATSLIAAPVFADPAALTMPSPAYVAPNMSHSSFGELKIVVPLTSPDKMVQMMKLRNISNSLKAVDKWGGSLDVRVVLYGKGLTLLTSPDDNVQAQLDALRARHVKFEVCNNSLLEQNIDFHTLYGVTAEDIVPAGFAEVAYLQARKGFVVDPLN
jgi:hypothetical protein